MPYSVPLSRVFRGRAAECRAMANSFGGKKTREHLLEVAADYESMANHEAKFELEDAHQVVASRYFNFGSRLIFGAAEKNRK